MTFVQNILMNQQGEYSSLGLRVRQRKIVTFAHFIDLNELFYRIVQDHILLVVNILIFLPRYDNNLFSLLFVYLSASPLR